jgi:Protein of unknown function (DUF5132)
MGAVGGIYMSDEIDGAASDDAEPVHSSNGSAWSSNDFKTKAATVGVVVIGAARKAREAAAEATEQVQDIVAEVHAENPEAPEGKPHA